MTVRKVAITGATGMIGSAVADALRPHFSLLTLGRASGNDRLADLQRPETLTADLFAGADTLVHCAGVVDEDFKPSSQPGFLKGTQAAKLLAESAFASGVRNFVYISSAHVYGPLSGTLDERSPPAPLSDYGIAHFATEQIFRRVATGDCNGRLLILRPCATYGVPANISGFQRWSLIPYLFPRNAQRDGKLSLLAGSDRIARNFVSARAVGEHIVDFLRDTAPGTRATINPLGLYSASVLDFAQLTARLYRETTGADCPVTMADGVPDLPPPLDYRSINIAQPVGESIEDFLRAMIDALSREAQAA